MTTEIRPPGGRLLAFLQSIRFRLTLWFVLMLALVLAAFSTFIYLNQGRALRDDAIGHLQEQAERIQTFLRGSEWEPAELSTADIPAGSKRAMPTRNGAHMTRTANEVAATKASVSRKQSSASRLDASHNQRLIRDRRLVVGPPG